MGMRDLPLTVFEERLLQRYLFFVMHSRDVNDNKARLRMKNLPNFPDRFNLVIPEVSYFQPIEVDGRTQKKIDYGGGVTTKSYNPDFVVYPKGNYPRAGPLSGEGIFVEVKWDYSKRFDNHQWLALAKKEGSIVASMDKFEEGEWESVVEQKFESLIQKYPELSEESWIKNAHNRIQHYYIEPEHFRDWSIRNIGALTDGQLGIGRQRFWLMLMSAPMMKNWDRMLLDDNKKPRKKPFWAWINDPENLSTLMKMSNGDEILFVHAKPLSGGGRWGNADLSDKQLSKLEYKVKEIYHLQIVSAPARSAYRCHLGEGSHSTFFEKCTDEGCKDFGCSGCNGGERRSMNNVEWPHFIEMKMLNSIELDSWKTLSRGSLGRRLGENGSKPYTPAELTRDEFATLRAQIEN